MPNNRNENNSITNSHPRPICPACGERMQRLFIRTYEPTRTGTTRQYVGIGWICKNPHCNYITRD